MKGRPCRLGVDTDWLDSALVDVLVGRLSE